MAEKVLWKVGGTQGHGTFEIVDVDGAVEIRLNGEKIAASDIVVDPPVGEATSVQAALEALAGG